MARLIPLSPLGEVMQHLDTVKRVIGPNEAFHHVDLAEDVEEIQHFDEEVQHHQIVAVSLATEHARARRQAVAYPNPDAPSVLALPVDAALHVSGHEAHILVESVRHQDIGVAGHLQDFTHVETRVIHEEAPHQTGNVKHERLYGQHDGCPLIVLNHVLFAILLDGQAFRDGRVIRVGNPAEVFRVLLPAACEFLRNKALDRFS